jgi:hypothetical protein
MSKILAIESSCDETAVAITDNGKLLANVVSSQVAVHEKIWRRHAGDRESVSIAKTSRFASRKPWSNRTSNSRIWTLSRSPGDLASSAASMLAYKPPRLWRCSTISRSFQSIICGPYLREPICRRIQISASLRRRLGRQHPARHHEARFGFHDHRRDQRRCGRRMLRQGGPGSWDALSGRTCRLIAPRSSASTPMIFRPRYRAITPMTSLIRVSRPASSTWSTPRR